MVAVHEQKCYVLILSKTSEAGWTERFLSEKKLDFVIITRTLNYKITLPPPPPQKKKKNHKKKNHKKKTTKTKTKTKKKLNISSTDMN